MNVQRSIKQQRERILAERRWWNELEALADVGDVKAFYAKYAEYLEWNNVTSKGRKILHKMALIVAGNK